MNPYSNDATVCKGYKECNLCTSCARNLRGKKPDTKNVFLLPPYKNKSFCIAFEPDYKGI